MAKTSKEISARVDSMRCLDRPSASTGSTAAQVSADSNVRTEVAPVAKGVIYAFCNGGSGDWWNMLALAEDGHCLAGHVCSHPSYGRGDMGVTGDWKHDLYAKHYPQGFEVVWIDDPRTDERLRAAYLKNQALAKDIEALK
jgi:hypothetical protein